VQVQTFKRLLLGSPIPSTLEKHERLGRATGLAVFASDALSSSAYATEEVLLILVAAGAIALHASVPIALGIALLIAIVVSSYRQTIQAYPGGGRALSPGARAVYVELDPDATRRLEDRWGKWGNQTPLVVLRSPYRSVVGPLLGYVDHLQQQLQQQDPNYLITIILPEFIPRRWWQHLLHNQTALLIKGALLFRRNIVVVDVPFHLEA
jgi:hypothetical protein